MTELRPVLTTDMSGRELVRWYWLQSELADFARSEGISASGGKQELTSRLVAFLDGDAPPTVRTRTKPPPLLVEPLTAATVIPVGQRCTEQLRRYFVALIGPSFRFDAPCGRSSPTTQATLWALQSTTGTPAGRSLLLRSVPSSS